MRDTKSKKRGPLGKRPILTGTEIHMNLTILGAATIALATLGGGAWARQSAPDLPLAVAKDGRATLPSGTVVELAGLTDDVRASTGWWKLTGALLPASPVELAPRSPSAATRSLRRLGLAVRIVPPAGKIATLKIVTAIFDATRKLSPLVFSVVEPKRPPGMKLVEFSAPPDARKGTLRLGVETAPGKIETAEFRSVPLQRLIQ